MPANRNGHTEAHWPVEPVPAAIGRSRRLAVCLVRRWMPGLPDEYLDQIRQVVGELVANAVQHAGGRITVDLWLTARGNLAVAVADPSPAPPVPREPYDDGTRGRGLHVVADQTITWSWRPEQGGKVVRATVALPTLTRSPVQRRAEPLTPRVIASRPDPAVRRPPDTALRGLDPAV